jgi:hypothetical protein
VLTEDRYIDPALIRAAAAAKTLPFVAEPVSGTHACAAIEDVLHRQDDPADELATTCHLVALADALIAASDRTVSAATL